MLRAAAAALVEDLQLDKVFFFFSRIVHEDAKHQKGHDRLDRVADPDEQQVQSHHAVAAVCTITELKSRRFWLVALVALSRARDLPWLHPFHTGRVARARAPVTSLIIRRAVERVAAALLVVVVIVVFLV